MTTATATRTTTFIYKVKAHGSCGSTAVRVKAGRNGCGETPKHNRATFVSKGEWVALITCDDCGKTFRAYGTALRGKVNAAKTCNARCMAATNGDCECECGGEQHGIHHA